MPWKTALQDVSEESFPTAPQWHYGRPGRMQQIFRVAGLKYQNFHPPEWSDDFNIFDGTLSFFFVFNQLLMDNKLTRSWYDIMLSKKQYANMPNQVLMDKQKISQKPLVFFCWHIFLHPTWWISPSNLVDFSIQPGGFRGWCINVTGRCVALKLVAHSPYGSSVWTWELGIKWSQIEIGGGVLKLHQLVVQFFVVCLEGFCLPIFFWDQQRMHF